MGAGRPTKYDPKYCDEMIEYFSVEPFTNEVTEVVSNGRKVQVVKEVASKYPSMAGFAVKIGVHRDTLQEWAKEHEQFSVAYKKAKVLQENWMLVNGLRGNVNVPFGIFISKNNLGYKDRQDIEVNQTKPFKFAYDQKDSDES